MFTYWAYLVSLGCSPEDAAKHVRELYGFKRKFPQMTARDGISEGSHDPSKLHLS